MTSTVIGDPASCSQLGGTLRRLATRLRTAGRAAHDAFDQDSFEAGEGARPRAALVPARRRVDLLDAAAAAAAREADGIGSALQAHASDLAEAIAQRRLLIDRAEAAGLRVADGELVPAWGVSGLADGTTSARQEAQREQLQAQLDAVAAMVGQRRQRLATTLRESHGVLAAHAEALRR